MASEESQLHMLSTSGASPVMQSQERSEESTSIG